MPFLVAKILGDVQVSAYPSPIAHLFEPCFSPFVDLSPPAGRHGNSGVVDQDVQGIKTFLDLSEHRLHLTAVRDIGPNCTSSIFRKLTSFDRLLSRFKVQVVHNKTRSFPSKKQ